MKKFLLLLIVPLLFLSTGCDKNIDFSCYVEIEANGTTTGKLDFNYDASGNIGGFGYFDIHLNGSDVTQFFVTPIEYTTYPDDSTDPTLEHSLRFSPNEPGCVDFTIKSYINNNLEDTRSFTFGCYDDMDGEEMPSPCQEYCSYYGNNYNYEIPL